MKYDKPVYISSAHYSGFTVGNQHRFIHSFVLSPVLCFLFFVFFFLDDVAVMTRSRYVSQAGLNFLESSDPGSASQLLELEVPTTVPGWYKYL